MDEDKIAVKMLGIGGRAGEVMVYKPFEEWRAKRYLDRLITGFHLPAMSPSKYQTLTDAPHKDSFMSRNRNTCSDEV